MKKQEKKHQALRTCASVFTTLLLMLLMQWPQESHASVPCHVLEPNNYSVTQEGINQLRFKFPCYDMKNDDCWIKDGTIYLQVEGEDKKYVVFQLKTQENISSSNWTPWINCRKGVDGVMKIIRTRGWSKVNVKNTNTQVTIPNLEGTGDTQMRVYVELLWTIPAAFRGKDITISWSIYHDGNHNENGEWVKIPESDFSIPASVDMTEPMLMDPIVSYDAGRPNQIVVPYMVVGNTIKKVSAYYKQLLGNTYVSKRTNLGTQASGFIWLSSERPVKDLYIVADVVDSEGDEEQLKSESIDVPMLHYPLGMTAAVLPSGKVEVKWHTTEMKWDDIMKDDSWEIQRNTTGKFDDTDANWMTIGQVSFDEGESDYSFIDETLLSSYREKPVYYRVRRSVSAVWGWNKEGGYALAPLYGLLSLNSVSNATAQRLGTWTDTSHGVSLNFTMGAANQYDEKRNLSPNGKYDKNGNFVIRSKEDWIAFANLVNNSSLLKTHNAIMAADVDLGNDFVSVGTEKMPYTGTFNGNGHTLTLNTDTLDVEAAAPFGHTNYAFFSNLHVTGSIISRQKFAAGLVGKASRSLKIDNCRSSVSISSTVSGDATNGGFVGVVVNTSAYLKNCIFDGCLIGEGCNKNGGFVGWSYVEITIENCLFAPRELLTDMNECSNFVRTPATPTEKVSIVNSYYTMSYGGNETTSDGTLIIYHEKDWETFVQKVKEAGGTKEVNAVLGGDITVTSTDGEYSQIVGSESAPYRGTFDGNGHTITLNINHAQRYMAPFRIVDGATIKNLKVNGTLVGGCWSAGIVGSALVNAAGKDNSIINCAVSADITTVNGLVAGGLMGHSQKSKIVIMDCLFDGKLTNGKDYDGSVVGAFLGDNISGSNNVISYNVEHGTYMNFARLAPAFGSNRMAAWGGTKNIVYTDAMEVGTKVGTQTTKQVLSILKSFYDSDSRTFVWEIDELDEVSPAFSSKAYGQGTPIGFNLSNELQNKLGAEWDVYGNNVMPIMHVLDDPQYNMLVWDDRANMVLNIEKTVDNKVRYTERYVLNEDERNAGKLQLDLTTPCVDHEFLFTVDKGNSLLSVSDSLGVRATKTDKGDLAIYKYNNNGHLSFLNVDTLQSSVSLTWDTDGGDVEYYRILRYDKQNPNKVETLVTDYTQMTYIDQTVRPQHNYVYTVEGVNFCEEEHITRLSKDGCCEPTGMVRGYVRLANGIGLPNVTVEAKPNGISGAATLSCVTDSTGYYEIGGLVYQKMGSYTLMASGSSDTKSVTFDEDINLFTNVNFYETTYFNLAGYVFYEGSSIPVSGVRFLRDDVQVTDASGKAVTTDNSGAFVVNIPQGTHRLQLVKEGHIFKNDGYYIDLEKTEGDQRDHNWQQDMSEIYFWDQTKVNLRGRVVGGNVQGTKPLGQSLSKNNLGDDVTIVVQLEGDHTSYIVRDQLDETVTERHYSVSHGYKEQDTTLVDAYRHRIVLHPDPKTGEYEAPFYPVKYKVTEIYAKGYPTLFQSGTLSQTLDLTDYADGDTATYSRIYHAVPTLDKWQFTGTKDRYFGLKQYISRDNAGSRDTLILWKDGKYSMGYPVYMAGSAVPMVLSAREEYYYNNDRLQELDVVQLDGGKVIAGNGLVSTKQTDEVELDSVGTATYVFTPENTTFTQEGDMALRTLKFTLMYDSCYYDIEPIKGYVMAAVAKPNGRHIMVGRNAHLLDILRDPPGASSTAYISQGSKLNYSYSADWKLTAGVNFSIGLGSSSNYYTGLYAGMPSGTIAGTTFNSKNYATLSYSLVSGYYHDWTYNYDFTTNQKISTTNNPKDIGAGGDVYIGMTDEVIIQDALAVRVVNSAAKERLMPGKGGNITVDGYTFKVNGTAKVLASGWDEVNQDSIYLVRDEVVQGYSQISATFAHSQSYILETLIPELFRNRNALILDESTTYTYAQTLANNTHKPVYVSKVSADSDDFAANPKTYTRFVPKGETDVWNDTIQVLNAEIKNWIGMVTTNEKEKAEANNSNLVKIYDFDGRESVSYSESFATSQAQHQYVILPASASIGGSGYQDKTNNNSGTRQTMDDDDNRSSVEYEGGGLKVTYGISPVASFSFNYKNGTTESISKESGFTLATTRKSNLTVAVYHTREISSDSIAKLDEQGYVYYKNVEENLKDLYHGSSGSSNTTSYISNLSTVPRFRNFVFRTLGGATAGPWEDERKTMFYNPGTILDQKTTKIDNLRIWTDNPSVSNVPYGEAARFKIYLSNESAMPNSMTNSLMLMLDMKSNPNGAKVFIDGTAMSSSGLSIWLDPNQVMTKEVEILAGPEYEYENIALALYDPNDFTRKEFVKLSAHFVPSAGKVNISKPGDKWIVNTESAYDADKQLYYLPVHIDGFDVNFRNFDHIELQYKLSTQGDKDWVSVCSYYHDSEEGRALMALASGERRLMDSDGYIDANFYGENDPIEQYYDLRAVVFCRQGNGYLTSSSNVLTGIKDTRRPMPFGTPQPVNGILGIGDDIKIAFSEPIASNYLSNINNFEVLGLTNVSNINLSTSLQFREHSYARSMANRNLANRDFTLDIRLKPYQTDKEMVVFSHGLSNDNFLKMGIMKDNRLMVNVSGKVIKSDSIIDFSEMRHVAYVFDVNEEENTTDVRFYSDNKLVGSGNFRGVYDGQSSLNFGGTYEGEMLEARLWNRALEKEELAKYADQRLNGYELGLIDNYPMNEGRGQYAYDKGVGSNDLELTSTTWKVPDGISMNLDGTEGVKLNSDNFTRQSYEDYSLMFWFRTDQANGTLMANGEANTELGYKDHFNIGLDEGKLFFRSGNFQVKNNDRIDDGSWHHMAVTINRARNVGNIYVDQKLKETFPVDTLGGIKGNNLALGATYTTKSNATSQLTGNIDEIAMFEMALPENVISNYASRTPSGEEMGLLVYLPFSRSEKQDNNTQLLKPTGISLRKYKDNHGDIVESHRDTIVAQDIVERFANKSVYAPMTNTGKLENIKYSYVADGKDLLINLDVPNYQIEKTNVYVTVKEVADLQGNLMASPMMMNLYVYRNALRWNVKRKNVEVNYGENTKIELAIENLSGQSQDYTIEGLPLWITASQTSGKISALAEEPITFTISPSINIGDYDEVIYIVGENGITEPLPLKITVRGEAPDWAVDDQLLNTNISMHLVARVIVDGEISHDTNDMLTAVGKGHRILGVTNIDVDQTTGANDGLAYLTIYNTRDIATPLTFEFYDASTGRIYVMEIPKADSDETVNDTIYFKSGSVLGTSTNPIIMQTSDKEVQAVKLKKGWNWSSFYIRPDQSTISNLLDGIATWEVGDGMEIANAGASHLINYKHVYDTVEETDGYRWDQGSNIVQLEPKLMYRFYVQSDKTLYMSGTNVSQIGITVDEGWNRIGYLSPLNLPVATALADYTDGANQGDMIKSQSEFAVLNIDASGNRVWKGTLKYMHSGEGYMLNRKGGSTYTFFYPIFSSGSKYNSDSENSNNAFLVRAASTMNVIARVEGIEMEEGDQLVAYGGGELRGMTTKGDDDLFFLSVGEGDVSTLSFAVEHDGEIVATTPAQMPYVDNGVFGTLSEPTVINFVSVDELKSDGWYSLQGIKLQGRPSLKGVYIHNGKRVTIK